MSENLKKRKRSFTLSKAAGLKLIDKKAKAKNNNNKARKGKAKAWTRTKTHQPPKPKAPAPLYVMERIVGKRINAARNRLEYCVKWKDYPETQNTWEGLHNLISCVEYVDAFEDETRVMFRNTYDAIATAEDEPPPQPTAAAAGRRKKTSKKSKGADADDMVSEDEAEGTNEAESDSSSSGEEPPANNKQQVLKRIDELSDDLELTPEAILEIKTLFNNLKMPVPMGFIDAVAAACIFVTCSNKKDETRDLEEIMSYVRVDKRALQKQISQINNFIKTEKIVMGSGGIGK